MDILEKEISLTFFIFLNLKAPSFRRIQKLLLNFGYSLYSLIYIKLTFHLSFTINCFEFFAGQHVINTQKSLQLLKINSMTNITDYFFNPLK
jgi:hypothetical protein